MLGCGCCLSLVAYCWLLVPRCLLLVACPSLLVPRCLLLVACPSLLVPRCLLLVACPSLLVACPSLLVVGCWLLVPRCLLLFVSRQDLRVSTKRGKFRAFKAIMPKVVRNHLCQYHLCAPISNREGGMFSVMFS